MLELTASVLKDQYHGEKVRNMPFEVGNPGNPNPSPETRFGGERANPHSSAPGNNKPWSIRHSIRYLAHRDIPWMEIMSKTEDELIRLLLPEDRVTLIQIGSARQIVRFAKGIGETAYITEQIDGKLAQTNFSADLAAVKGMTNEQLLAIINEPLPDGIESLSPDGIQQPAAGSIDDEGEAERP